MPKEKEFKYSIPKIYKRQFEDLVMFGYIIGMGDILRSFNMDHIPIEDRIFAFMKRFNIENANSSSLQVTYTKMQQELIENEKKSIKDIK